MQVQNLSDVEEIRKVFERDYADAMRLRNPEVYGQMYTQDAVWMPPNDTNRSGVANIKIGFTNQIADKYIDPKFTAEEIKIIGDLGYVIGFSIAQVTPVAGGATKTVRFHALWIMKKENGKWKIDRQIWNNKQ
ncbi:nuclear transport factor 2 family protein [Cylindrospermopsis raciborskii]|uniref:nuclear transport factor 2 family protein n=1 Tax=Cylindrospermopsis raciborskii TaxID=77022 RepID=UPI0001C1682F|nr:nuclear transport factor 2 family protein [Cylindrospermopsis raciborskii]EFA71894.1 hypothetical protein CRD_02412 [Raphidiopsis brookii D9]MCZ2201354.1 nuclear transport factor 2 family protein [Cylindrospermopsis raciborskii PAMP2012]MCZ2206172.1 nuclear transport factor 2 family protein [Cylindrospermopsis raciborskii PAMP2011]NLQ04802.1 nuclear transport factor 2 family protein [Cylindrospermopsis raciborskii MVCC19]OHY33694.1 DUF4440 domain-containing protein [Cylindrospermopsis racib